MPVHQKATQTDKTFIPLPLSWIWQSDIGKNEWSEHLSSLKKGYDGYNCAARLAAFLVKNCLFLSLALRHWLLLSYLAQTISRVDRSIFRSRHMNECMRRLDSQAGSQSVNQPGMKNWLPPAARKSRELFLIFPSLPAVKRRSPFATDEVFSATRELQKKSSVSGYHLELA